MQSKEIEKKQPFLEHLLELRSCLIKAFTGWLVAAIFIYVFSDEILEFIINPLRPYLDSEAKVYFRGLADVFSIQIKLSAILGFILSSPYIIYQLWVFIAPGLYPHEKKWLSYTIIFTSFSFLTGALTAYYLFLPFLLNFFYSFGEKFLVFKPYLKEYISFLLKILLLFGLFFQVPSIIFLLNKLNIFSLEQIKNFRPYAIILSFVFSGLITTGVDPLNQILIALPLTILYEIGILLIKLTNLRRR